MQNIMVKEEKTRRFNTTGTMTPQNGANDVERTWNREFVQFKTFAYFAKGQ